MGSLREEEEEEDESRPERHPAGLGSAVGVSVSAASKGTPEASALALREGGPEPAAVGAAGRPRLSEIGRAHV